MIEPIANPEKFDYVGLDVETTGFGPDSAEIIEVSAIEFNLKGEIGTNFTQLCWPISGHIPSGASNVNHIYIDMVRGCPNYFKDGVRDVLAKFIGDRILVGHNLIAFDHPFIKINVKGLEDTLLMCREKYARGNNLKMACKRAGIKWNDEEAHRSEYDTIKCIELFCHMKNESNKKKSDTETLDMFKNLPGAKKSDLKRIGIIPTEADKRMLATQAYSYSRINLYHQCPFKWYMRYIKKHPEPDVDYLITGKICHTIAEWCGDWCSRELFSNKISAYVEKKKMVIPDLGKPEESMGTFLYNNPHKVKEVFPGFPGRASLMREMDNVLDEESYERPSMPDWDTFDSLMQEAFRRHKCTDVKIVTDVIKIMTRFFERSDFSLCTGEVTITEKRLAFDKHWKILKDFFANDVFFRAIIDVINFFGDRVVIRDYKSSRSMLKESELLEDKQMQIYLLMIYYFLPRGSYKTITIEIDYIRFGKQISVDVNENDIERIAKKALKWIGDSIQDIEKEMLKDDGTAFQPRRNEFCHTCHLAEEGKCPLFDKRVINDIEDPDNFRVSDMEDCHTAWKRVEANKAENTRLMGMCKKFVKNSEVMVPIDKDAVLDFYVSESREYNAEKVVKELLSREVDIKYIIKFLNINKKSFDALCEIQGIEFDEEELDNLSVKSTKSEFKALTEQEVIKGKYLNG